MMNFGLIAGRVVHAKQPAAGVRVYLDCVEATSEFRVTRGIHGTQQRMALYPITETRSPEDAAPAAPGALYATTNALGAYVLWFRFNWLGSGGVTNSMTPYYHFHGRRRTGSRWESTPVMRARGWLTNSVRTMTGLMGINVPTSALDAFSTGVDIASILTDAQVRTLPSPLVGRTIMEEMMFISGARFSIK